MSKNYLDYNGLETYDGLMKNWVNAKKMELTQDEYDALTEEEKNNGTVYMITDGASGVGVDSYDELTDRPSINNVTLTGNKTAANLGLVADNDSRLTDSRPASDVYAWAKESAKPTYTANEVGAIASTAKGASNGVAELDSNGLVPSSQLPSYVDDVIEAYYNTSNDTFYTESTYEHAITPESDKIYIDLTTNKTYRWGGSTYVTIGSDLAIGETSTTAYRGDRGKELYDAFGGKSAVSAIDTSADIPTSNAVKTYVDDAIQTNITSVLNTGF